MAVNGKLPFTLFSVEYLRNVLSYDPATGLFVWLNPSANRVKTGDVAGSVSGSGYLYIYVKGRSYSAHRLAWFYTFGEWPLAVDHINGDKLDNRVANLRVCTLSQNQGNAKRRKDSTTGFKGVYRVNSGFGASIQHQKKQVFLGVFKTPELAHGAYLAAAKRLFNEFARAA